MPHPKWEPIGIGLNFLAGILLALDYFVPETWIDNINAMLPSLAGQIAFWFVVFIGIILYLLVLYFKEYEGSYQIQLNQILLNDTKLSYKMMLRELLLAALSSAGPVWFYLISAGAAFSIWGVSKLLTISPKGALASIGIILFLAGNLLQLHESIYREK